MRKIFSPSSIIPVFNYVQALLINSNDHQLKNMQTLLMRVARSTIGHPCFKWSTKKILNRCGWMSIQNMITNSSLTFLHKIFFEKLP